MAQGALLKNVLSNLVINAVQAMPNWEELKIRAQQEAGDKVIAIQDTAIDLSDKVKPSQDFSIRSSKLNRKVKA